MPVSHADTRKRTSEPLTAEQRRLVDGCQGFVRSIAWKVHRKVPRHLVDLDDLIAYGQLGLCDAAREFDPNRAVKFTTYAYYRVRGSILDGLTQMSWFRPDEYHGGRYERISEEVVACDEADGGDGSPVGDDRVPDRLRRATTRLAVTYLFCQLAGSGDDGPADFSDGLAGEHERIGADLERSEMLTALQSLVGSLPDREREFLRAIYVDGQTIKEAGERTGISKSWASRLHTQLLEQLARGLAS